MVIDTYQATHIAFAIEGDALASSKYASSVILRDEAIAGLKSGHARNKAVCGVYTDRDKHWLDG